jgi:hypothetical protein
VRIIAGPCQHESLPQSLEIARECKRVCDKYGIEYYFKASYDKANRSSESGIRGLGLETTLLDFLALKVELGVKTLTDVHDYVQVARIEREFKDAVDVYQIPAFLCRQTDLIKAACATDKIVNIKKGQFMALVLAITILSLTILVLCICSTIMNMMLFLIVRTLPKNPEDKVLAQVAIVITCLGWLVVGVLWGSGTFSWKSILTLM